MLSAILLNVFALYFPSIAHTGDGEINNNHLK